MRSFIMYAVPLLGVHQLQAKTVISSLDAFLTPDDGHDGPNM
jgi:hypothetical protein